jgi:hypothetical protein
MFILPAASLEGAGKRVLIHRGDIVGTWVGLTTDELQMVRLMLAPDGKGTLGSSFLAEEPCVVRIALWTFGKGKITLVLDDSPAPCPLDREFHGVVKGNALELTVRGAGWKRTASLRKEDGLAKRWKRLQGAMSNYGLVY